MSAFIFISLRNTKMPMKGLRYTKRGGGVAMYKGWGGFLVIKVVGVVLILSCTTPRGRLTLQKEKKTTQNHQLSFNM